jgi:hypothetical protein
MPSGNRTNNSGLFPMTVPCLTSVSHIIRQRSLILSINYPSCPQPMKFQLISRPMSRSACNGSMRSWLLVTAKYCLINEKINNRAHMQTFGRAFWRYLIKGLNYFQTIRTFQPKSLRLWINWQSLESNSLRNRCMACLDSLDIGN